MKTKTGASLAALAFGLGLAATPVFAADGPDKDRNDQPAAEQQQQPQHENQGDRGARGDHRGNPMQNQGGQKPSSFNKTDYNSNTNDNDNDRNRDRDRDRSHRNNTDYNNNNNYNNDRDRDRDRYRSNRNNSDYNNNDNDRRNDNDRFNRNHRPNVNINVYRRNITSPRRFRIGIYHAPRGYYYRRWHYGERLPINFYARDYWLLDYVAYGLFAPPPGYVWVRYGPDALLIDTETGEILQVRYDVFYT
jgi:Ni/Co efflux regulator RcnB